MPKLLGSRIIDKFSGIEMTCVGIRHMFTGCKHVFGFRYGVDSSGNAFPMETLDLHTVKDYEQFEVPEPKGIELLGKSVIDTVTDFKGVCVYVVEYVHTTTRVGIQAKGIVPQTGNPPEPFYADLINIKLMDDKLRKVLATPSFEEEPTKPRKTGASVSMPGRTRLG